MTFKSEPTTPGQQGSALFGLKSSTNHATSAPVKFSAVSATIGANGSAGKAQAFTRTSPNSVKVSGVATVSAVDVSMGTAGPGDQTLVGSLTASASAVGSYQARAASPKVTAKCNCNGTGTVTGVISQASGAAEGKYTLKVDGSPAKTITLAAGKRTGDIVVTAADKSVVTFTAQYLVNGSWTAPVALGGSFTVNCPAMPDVSFSAQCNCSAATGTGYTTKVILGLDNPSKTYTDQLVWTVNGVRHSETVPANGSATPVTLTVGEAASVTYEGIVEGTTLATPLGSWNSQP